MSAPEIGLTDTRAFTAGLPSKRVAAGVLFTDVGGRLLLVKPAYKDYWDLPGGVADRNESPGDTATREVKEELGLVIQLGRLLVVDYFPDRPGAATEALMFVYDGGQLTDVDQAQIQLQTAELRSWAWWTPDEALERTAHAPLLRRRITAAWHAHRDGITSYLEAGIPQPGQPSLSA